MYQTDFARTPPERSHDKGAEIRVSKIDPRDVAFVYGLNWGEHCVECAVPHCYRNCPVYVERADRKCARFRYGIYPNPDYRGLYEFGADVSFRRWGKIESWLEYRAFEPAGARRVMAIDRAALKLINPVSAFFKPINPNRQLNGAYIRLREKAFRAMASPSAIKEMAFDEFVVEGWSLEDRPFNLILESFRGRWTFRASLTMNPGHNLHRIPYNSMDVNLAERGGKILLYPENDAEVRVVFTWLDFVKYAADASAASIAKPPMPSKPAAKVKCLVWDLDNTLWRGVLVEDGPENVQLNPAAVEIIRELDERGILQSIASKNDNELAAGVLKRFGLDEYFLAPQINWGPKSASLQRAAEELNLGLDAFAFVDDMPFERAEVNNALPQVRVYAHTELPGLVDKPEFDVPVTEEGRNRRASYRAEFKRRKVAVEFQGNYEKFLESCSMRATLGAPQTPEQIDRCLELLQRSNQLNLSTHRYERDEFLALLENEKVFSMFCECRDNFGEYGIVGFASVEFQSEGPLLKDLVISCRVAQKKLENAWMAWLCAILRDAGFDRLRARYVPTSRNHVLRSALADAAFGELESHGEAVMLAIDCDTGVPHSHIVHVDAESLASSIAVRSAQSVSKVGV